MDELKGYFDKKDIQPIDDKDFFRHHSMSTPGGVLREIGRRSHEEDVQYLLKITMSMIKQMDACMQEYRLIVREERKRA
jgi:hypothetical protein